MLRFLDRDSTAPLRLGVAGFGRLARNYYVPALRRMRGVRVAVVADPLEGSRAAARAAFGDAAVCSDPAELLARPLDALLVASPPSTHLDLWEAAAGLGLPVFMEKPLVPPGQFARVQTSARDRRLLMVDLNRRFWPAYRRVREAVDNGAIGEPEVVRVDLQVDIRPWCAVTSHRLQPGEGGALYDLGSQAIDLGCWVAGREARTIRAWTEVGRNGDERVRLELELRGGTMLHCYVGYGTPTFECIALRGTLGRVWLRDPNMAVHLGRRNSRTSAVGRVRDLALLGYRGLRRSRAMSRYTIAMALASFVHCIRHGGSFDPGFDDALRNASLLETASRSMKGA